MFVTVGMSEQAVSAFTRASLVKEAIDSCVALNQVSFDRSAVCAQPMGVL